MLVIAAIETDKSETGHFSEKNKDCKMLRKTVER